MRNFLLLTFMFITYCCSAQQLVIGDGIVDGANSYFENCSASFINRSDDVPTEGDYRNNEDYYVTICPTNHDLSKKITVDFTQFDLEEDYDVLKIYDDNRTQAVPEGATVASHFLLGTYTGTTSPGKITSTRGCLTFHFVSDHSIVKNGWRAAVSCGTDNGSGNDCEAREIECGKMYTGNTQHGRNNRERYNCEPTSMEGRELVYKITTTQRGDIKATLTTSSSLDLDIFILKDCYTNCVAKNTNGAGNATSIVRYNNAAAGDYYIVIDGQYSNTYGSFNLMVDCDDENGNHDDNDDYDDCLVSDNFEDYYAGDNVSYYNSHVWKKWSNNVPDGKVSTDRSVSGRQALEINRGQYGAQDVILKLGNRTSGIYKVSWKMYINDGDEAYFNLQNSTNALKSGGEFSFKFQDHQSTYQNRWFNMELYVDLDRNRLKLLVDNGRYEHDRNYYANLGGINFYATSDAHFYIDDVCMTIVRSIPFASEEDSASSRSKNTQNTSPFVVDVPVQKSTIASTPQQKLTVSPNPTKGITTLNLNLTQEEAINITIFNQTGQVVKQVALGQQTYINQSIDLTDLPNGMYILKAHGTTTNLSQKVLVQH